ncbi:MAG: RelA/SpoT domain-containing protein [Eubacterium sp.]|nr:RelA/SpoT domain-containing protein [Eubacterium sp.]
MNELKDLRLKEYDDSLENLRRLEEIVSELLERTLREGGIRIMQIAHRIKTRESVAEKLERKSEKYPRVSLLTDLVGFRLICYFDHQVDQMAELVGQVLEVDRKKSTDKRKTIEPTAFGYLSLHYICSLPKGKGYPEELTGFKFEIQFRTVLQHAWAEIEHDLGYKTEFGIPLDVRREFSRVAGLLEIADETFEVIRNRIAVYEDKVRKSIAEDKADHLPLDLVTLKEYIKRSKTMQELLQSISDISGAELVEVSPENQLERLNFFGIKTLGELNRLIEEETEHARLLAAETLTGADLDELADTVGLYYVMRARLIFGGYRPNELLAFCRIMYPDSDRADKQVDILLKQRQRYLQ